MIEVYELNKLLESFGIDIKKVLSKNTNILDRGSYYEIKEILNFLIKELEIPTTNIERCPSIMYSNIDVVKSNYDFLKKSVLNNYDVKKCLHVLCANPNELIKTYNYVLENYGYEILSSITSVLSVNVDRIKQLENNFSGKLDKKIIISLSFSRLSINEIYKIIEFCNKYNINITSSIFKHTVKEIEKIINVCQKYKIKVSGGMFTKTALKVEKIINTCQKYNIDITGSVFLKTAEEIEKLAIICKKNNIKLTGNVFNKSPEEVEKIVEICKRHNIPITGSVFFKNSSEIEKIVEICNFNKIEISSSMFLKSSGEMQRIISICQKHNIPITGTIFLQSSEEIEKIISICKEYKLSITGNIFSKSAIQIKQIVDICIEHGIKITGSVFQKNPEETKKIIELCNKYGIKITGSIFKNSARELEKSIKYIKENYSDKYLTSLIVSRKSSYLEKVFPYLTSLGVLDVVINSASILTLTLEEIIERKEFVESIDESIIVNGKFNIIFGLSKKKYRLKVEHIKKIKN